MFRYVCLKISIYLNTQLLFQTTSTRTSIRVNLPRNSEMSYMSRAKEKTTNLALTVVIVFIITNTPYMVIEFMRQGIISDSW